VGKGITAFKRGVKDSAEEIENQTQTADSGDGSAARDVTPESSPQQRDNA
jgi:sec-independent protein translocase protein TatA